MDANRVEPERIPPGVLICPGRPDFRRVGFDVLSLLALTIVSVSLGCLANVLRAKPLPWRYQSRADSMGTALAKVAPAPSGTAAPVEPADPSHEIRLEAFQAFVQEHKGLVLDARPAVFYQAAHVPGAVSLPRETFSVDYPRLRPRLEAYKDLPIAIYCSGPDCPDSQLVSDTLGKLGYRHLLIYTSGWEEWSQTGLPQEGATPQS